MWHVRGKISFSRIKLAEIGQEVEIYFVKTVVEKLFFQLETFKKQLVDKTRIFKKYLSGKIEK